jgi:hypothetical protein
MRHALLIGIFEQKYSYDPVERSYSPSVVLGQYLESVLNFRGPQKELKLATCDPMAVNLSYFL